MEMGFKSRNNVRLTEGAVPSVQSLSLSAASAAASGGASANAGFFLLPFTSTITATEKFCDLTVRSAIKMPYAQRTTCL
uniref:Uncharacterized protein n=1 Tax=Knipowitschia caucasica TaxID=637954 RepID=A0AAV2LJ46_KNICA